MIHSAVANAQEALRQLLLQYPKADTVWVGFSGGLDSTALLFIAKSVISPDFPKVRLRAVYVNHNLQADASAWAIHCSRLAAQLAIDIQIVSVTPRSASEEDARNARYQAYEELLSPGDLLLLGHHRDDQAETLLMRMFRGSGVSGLGGMAPIRCFGKGWILRPFLKLGRQDLQHVVEQAQLSWIDDPSNLNTDYLRNWIRNILAPVLQQRWPGWSGQLSRTADALSEADELNRQLALIDADGEFMNPLSVKRELVAQPVRFRNLVYHWLVSQDIRPGSRVQLDDLVDQYASGGKGQWSFSGRSVYLYQSQLWVVAQNLPQQSSVQMELQIGSFELAYGQLEIELSDSGLRQGLEIVVRPRRAADRIRLPGGSQSVKKFMNAQKVPPWLRDSWPLIEVENEIIAIVGLWVDPSWLEKGGVKLNWRL